VIHHFALDEFELAYEVFANAAETGALKVSLSRTRAEREARRQSLRLFRRVSQYIDRCGAVRRYDVAG